MTLTLNQRIGRALARAFGYHYEASRVTREHRHPLGATAQDSKLDASEADRTMLLKLARYLCSNVGLVRGAIADLARYSVGTGIRPQAQSGDEAWDAAAEAFFAQWSQQADVTGRHTFGEIQRLQTFAIAPTSILSRATAGTRGRCLIVNLPGKPGAVTECLAVLGPALRKAIDILSPSNP